MLPLSAIPTSLINMKLECIYVTQPPYYIIAFSYRKPNVEHVDGDEQDDTSPSTFSTYQRLDPPGNKVVPKLSSWDSGRKNRGQFTESFSLMEERVPFFLSMENNNTVMNKAYGSVSKDILV